MIFAKAIESYQSGNFEQADDICRKIIRSRPNHAEALYLLGLINAQAHQYDSAAEYINRALQIKPDFADAYNNLGIIHRMQGKLDEATRDFYKAVELKPGFTHAMYNLACAYQAKGSFDAALPYFQEVISREPNHIGTLYFIGIIMQMKGLPDEASAYFDRAVALYPNFADAHFALGSIFQSKGKIDDAISHYHKAIESDPYHAEAYNNLGVIFQGQEQFSEAVSKFKKAIELNPKFVQAFNNLGNTYKDLGEWENAIENYIKAVEIRPDYVLAHYNLGNILGYQGRHEEAIKAYDRAIEYKSNFVIARWAKCVSQLPIIYPDQQSINSFRKRYSNELRKLQNTIPLETMQDVEAAAEAVGSHQPFLLAYQGLNDRGLQEIYGDLVYKIMTKRYPQFSKDPAVHPREILRIGIVSAYFHLHSVWKIPIRGWMDNLDKNRFQIFGYHTGRTKDHLTEYARKHCNRFVEGICSFEELSDIIWNDKLDVVIYPEIGMDPMTARLASLRLAPVQCASWGHPDTSGLPTIDYYLSSDLMEPSDADSHYSEKLVRLPNLSICYTPVEITPAPISRATFDLRQNSMLYLCCQSLFKYLPQYDEVLPRIAKLVGNCQFLFISEMSSHVTEQFRSRIKMAFRRFTLEADEYVVFLPRLQPEEYIGVNLLSDIFLDSIDWSGCNSTLEAIACNLPLVTLPGSLMRGRHSMAILNMMGLTETIASSVDDYINIAVRLGKDFAWRRQITQKIAAKKHLIYNDRTCIRGLEDFLEKAIKEKS